MDDAIDRLAELHRQYDGPVPAYLLYREGQRRRADMALCRARAQEAARFLRHAIRRGNLQDRGRLLALAKFWMSEWRRARDGGAA